MTSPVRLSILPLLLLSASACSPTEPPPQLVTSVQAAAFDSAPPIARKYQATVTREWRLVWGITAPIPVAAAQLQQESGWNPSAVSPAGARGLAQFMPYTAKDFPDDNGQVLPDNPDWSVRAQSRYMHLLYTRVVYPDDCNRIGAALSSYNGGAGWHDKRQKKAADPADFWNSVRTINPGVTPASQAENADYPERIVYKIQPTYRTWGPLLCSI